LEFNDFLEAKGSICKKSSSLDMVKFLSRNFLDLSLKWATFITFTLGWLGTCLLAPSSHFAAGHIAIYII
jgi:hypothetical protein